MVKINNTNMLHFKAQANTNYLPAFIATATSSNTQMRENVPNNKVNGNFSVPNLILPEGERNYCLFNQNRVNFIISQKELALPYLKRILQTSKDEGEIVEALYILDGMIDNGTKGISAMYPDLARFNNTESPNIQTFLAGIYRKILVPDAFGPLLAMLIRNSIPTNQNSSPQIAPFDPNEAIGGAILAYIENYSNGPKKIDYKA